MEHKIKITKITSAKSTQYYCKDRAPLKEKQGRGRAFSEKTTLYGIKITKTKYEEILASGTVLHRDIFTHKEDKYECVTLI